MGAYAGCQNALRAEPETSDLPRLRRDGAAGTTRLKHLRNWTGAEGLLGEDYGPDGAAGGRGRSHPASSGLHYHATSRELADSDASTQRTGLGADFLLKPTRHGPAIYS